MIVFQTKDGSHTVLNEQIGHHYHSIHGAFEETKRIFIELGLHEKAKTQTEISIFEMGFGTGFNALFTASEAKKLGLKISYVSVEAFPLALELVNELNYDSFFDLDLKLKHLHETEWNKATEIIEDFNLTKLEGKLEDISLQSLENQFDVIYFDAFSPRTQPELWTAEVFKKMYKILKPEGILTTYSTRRMVKDSLISAGFSLEKLKGPRFKKHVLKARK